jgi:ABC-type glycerol-3-phosphate transport system substrate-binding protein
MKHVPGALRACLAAALVALSGHAARAEPVHLTWFMWSGTEPEVVAWKHVAGLVTQKFPDITVEFQTTSFPDYWTKLPALAAAGKLPDIVSLQSLRAPGFADLMVPLDDRIAAESFDIGAFDPSIVKGLSRNGKQFALPYDFGPLVLYYNHDMFEKAGLPLPAPGWTEADFMRDAKALTKDGMFGFAASVPDAFLVFARSKGAHYLDAKGQLDLANAGMKSAFTQYTALVSLDKVAPLLPASGVQSSSMANGRFTSGNVAMYVDGPWQLLNIKKKASFTVGMAPVPAREAGSITVSAGSGFGIATTSTHKEAAWKAIQVMTGPEAEQYLGEAGRAFAARKDLQKYWYDVAAAGVVGAHEALPAALKTAEPYVTTPNWATVAALFEQYAPLAFGGSEQPGKVLDTIQNLASQ